jgi:hypothetical protein
MEAGYKKYIIMVHFKFRFPVVCGDTAHGGALVCVLTNRRKFECTIITFPIVRFSPTVCLCKGNSLLTAISSYKYICTICRQCLGRCASSFHTYMVLQIPFSESTLLSNTLFSKNGSSLPITITIFNARSAFNILLSSRLGINMVGVLK